MNEDEALALISGTLQRGLKLSSLHGLVLSDSDREKASDQLLGLWRQTPEVANTPGKHGAFLGFRYVIPDSDLNLIECVTSVMTTTAGIGFLLPALGYEPHKGIAAAVTGVIVALIKLFHNLGLSVHLDVVDYTIVALLHHAGRNGLSAKELRGQLKDTFPQLTSEAMTRRLTALTTCSTLKGTKSALTWKDSHHRWHVNGI